MLRSHERRRALDIQIGSAEALAISSALEGTRWDRPMTHDLLGEHRERPICGHCSQHPSIVEVNGLPLCLDCWGRLQAAERTRIETALQVGDELSRMLNFTAGQIEAAVGMPGIVPRIALRQPAPFVQTGPMTF